MALPSRASALYAQKALLIGVRGKMLEFLSFATCESAGKAGTFTVASDKFCMTLGCPCAVLGATLLPVSGCIRSL